MNFINKSEQNNQHTQYKQQVIKNKGFLLLHEEFTKLGWYLAENEFNHIVYEKEGHKCDVFSIDIFDNYIKVNVPIGNTNYCYSTKFTEYFKAQEFVLMHLYAITEKIKEKKNKKSLQENDNLDNDAQEDD